MNRIVKRTLILIYIIVLVFLTVYLFSYNKFGIAEFSNHLSFANINSSKYSSNDLIIVKKSEKEAVKVNDDVFYYYAYNANNNVSLSTVKEVSKTNDQEYTYLLADGKYLSSSYLIGIDKNTIKVPFIGKIIYFFTKPAVYFITVVIPIHIVFMYETFIILKDSREKNLGVKYED